jgi:ABC-type lipoprotein export system ATPase subunit
VIELKNLVKTYQQANQEPVQALDNVSLRIDAGEFVAILGPSGSGKSTLMNVMGLLDGVDSGEYLLNGQAVRGHSDDELARTRNAVLGFVFQAYHLLPRTTAAENVQLPLLYANRKDYVQRSHAALEAVGLAARSSHYASELSGGQQQRVAIARAIANEPKIILADEPTGNLDSAASGEIMALFHQLHRAGTTIVLVTHDMEVARQAQRVIRVRDGAIEADERTQPQAAREEVLS